ncbi:ABC-F family ATP-binding cassette domain-containing protein [Actinomyces vulturis]|uniref:ABC-F family ATP-binding cassette domain-containing protein n=1 Tax=Actinomyces vulturis TaxID=1857645 RepID=UPI00082F3688|nr:ABC-F family ATP-binding cassette domain-containing protein [Actinomyces vulturis]
MAHLLGLENIGIMVGSRRLLEDITLGVDDGSRIGVLGPNGSGKSTLLSVLAGMREADAGQVTRARGVALSILTQVDEFDDLDTVVATIHGDTPEHEWAGNPTIRDIHEGLLRDVSLEQKIGELSGGQRRRVALARVLSQDSDVLILDEPTNHLDVEGVAWLAQHVNARFASKKDGGALIVVTHDRWFLDAVCTRIWDVVPSVDPGNGRPQIPGYIETYEGGYAAFILARNERARQAQVSAQKRDNALRKELAWLRRGAPARTSKPKFRIEAAEALIADVPPPRDTVELIKMATARLGKKVIDLENVGLAYPRDDGDETEILRDVTWRLAPGERVGIIGVNGAGKTTLLRLLEGVLEPTAGRVVRGKTVQLAVLSQSTHELDALADKRVIEAVSDVARHIEVGGKELTASQLVERLGFTKQRAWTRVAEISGGERRRLQLLRLLMTEPNVLLLDEPTNDLDTDTLASLEDLLDSFPGTLVVVSHDRYLLERVTDHQIAVLGDGSVRDLPGGIDEYLHLIHHRNCEGKEWNAEFSNPGPQTGGVKSPGDISDEVKTFTSAERREMTKELSRIERQLHKYEEQREKIHAEIVAISTTMNDSQKLVKLSQDLKALDREVDELESRWVEISEYLI